MNANRPVTVINDSGIHARPSGEILKLSMQFDSDISIENVSLGVSANAKSMIELCTLMATRGSQLNVVADGADAQAAVDAVASLIESGFDG